MPRRRALTGAQLAGLLALPAAEADLIRHWTPDQTDLAAIDRRRGDHNRLGFALQLCALRYPGRVLRPGEVVPDPALRFVAEQVGAPPEAFAATAPAPRRATSSWTRCARPTASATSPLPAGRRSRRGCCPSRSPPPAPPRSP
jgi:hypothetical protein